MHSAGLAGARVLVIGSGKAGHEVNAKGVAEALGCPTEFRRIAPRPFFEFVAPYGPMDPRERAAFLSEPLPDIAIACGRATVPYLRALKQAGGRGLFAVCLQDPRVSRGLIDLIWTPSHDKLRGPNVLTTLTSPHPFSRRCLKEKRAAPDVRLVGLPRPRAAIILGGPSGAQFFTDADFVRMRESVQAIVAQGYSVMATPSRRTPQALLDAVQQGAKDAPAFLWDGSGANPYGCMLALAEATLVTGDSANMVGEAVATGSPVYIFEPSGGASPKLAAMIGGLIAIGAARRFAGRFESYTYEPIDSSAEIAAEIARRLQDTREHAKA